MTDKEINLFDKEFSEHNPPVLKEARIKNRDNNSILITELARRNPNIQILDKLCWLWVERAQKQYMENQFLFYGYPRSYLKHRPWRGDNIMRIYDVNDSYQWHIDHVFDRGADISYLFYINDDFKGGKTCFFNDRIGITPKKGSALCFPVDHYHIHKSLKITEGHKKVIWNCVYSK